VSRILLDNAASAVVTTGSKYNDTAGAQVSNTQAQLKSNLSALNTMTSELMNTRTTTWGTTAPTGGSVGDIRWHTAPVSAGHVGWINTTSGWAQFGVIEALP
jgi:hypothetical protein